MRGIWSPTAGLGAPPPGRPSAFRGAGAEKFGGTAGLRASLLRNPLAPLPLPRPSPPSAWAHVRASPAAREGRGRGAGKANFRHSDPDPGALPSSQASARPLPRPRPRPSALGALGPATLTRGSSSSILGGEGPLAPAAVWIRSPRGNHEEADSPQLAASGSTGHRCSEPRVEPVQVAALASPTLPTRNAEPAKSRERRLRHAPPLREGLDAPLFAPPSLKVQPISGLQAGTSSSWGRGQFVVPGLGEWLTLCLVRVVAVGLQASS